MSSLCLGFPECARRRRTPASVSAGASSEPRGSVSAWAAVITGQTLRPRGQRAVSGGAGSSPLELSALPGTVQRPSKEGKACTSGSGRWRLLPAGGGEACSGQWSKQTCDLWAPRGRAGPSGTGRTSEPPEASGDMFHEPRMVTLREHRHLQPASRPKGCLSPCGAVPGTSLVLRL